jgi:hypothetical protein
LFGNPVFNFFRAVGFAQSFDRPSPYFVTPGLPKWKFAKCFHGPAISDSVRALGVVHPPLFSMSEGNLQVFFKGGRP